MPADFARVAPGSLRHLVAGGNVTLAARHGLVAGRTDAGRPELPRPPEVCRVVSAETMPADFARVAPGSLRHLVAGGNVSPAAHHGLVAGRTDAGRPELPRAPEVEV